MSRHHKHSGVAKGPAWERLRRACFDRDGWRCTKCRKAGRLEAHHVKELDNGGANTLANLATLCRSCHIEHHRKPEPLESKQWRQVEALR